MQDYRKEDIQMYSIEKYTIKNKREIKGDKG